MHKILNGKAQNVIDFLKGCFPKGIQAFDNRNIAGDRLITIYNHDDVQVDYCPFWQYVEIFGLDPIEFQMVRFEIEKDNAS